MKRLIIITLLLISANIIGQENNKTFKIEKHSWSIEGDLFLNSQEIKSYIDNDSDRDYFGIGIAPKFGYAINHNLIIGIGLGYEYSKTDFKNPSFVYGNTTRNTFSVFPYIKKYVPLGKRIAMYFQGETKFSTATDEFKGDDSTEYKTKNLFIGIRPGLSFKISEKLLLQANVGSLGYTYNKLKRDNKNDEKINNFNFNLSTSDLSFGLSFIL